MRNSTELPVGRIAGVFGIHGEVKCDPTSAGRTLFCTGETLRALLPGGESESLKIASVREHKGRLLIRIDGANSADEAQRFVGATFYAERDRIHLEPGEYLDRDLEGCSVYDSAGAPLGTVESIEHYPSSDMLVVGGKLVPMIREFIVCVDVDGRRIVVNPPEGLLD